MAELKPSVSTVAKSAASINKLSSHFNNEQKIQLQIGSLSKTQLQSLLNTTKASNYEYLKI